jgi:dimethylhistidine N-methyltransferase
MSSRSSGGFFHNRPALAMNPQCISEPDRGVVRFYNFLPEGKTFLDEVLEGLSRPQKAIPPKYFYDERGSRLFEAICDLPEYYPTRTEMAILRAHLAAMVQFVGPEAELIEFGSGAGIKTQILVEALHPPLYVPIDIDSAMLKKASGELARLFPWINITGICADYSLPLVLPQFVGVPIRRKAVFFPGSTIGNLTPEEALEFLRRTRSLAGTGGVMLIGVDLKKDKALLDAAYDDAQGVTAQFNLNLLARINCELGGDFQPQCFAHRAFYDEAQGRIEMHLESLYSQFVRIAGRRFDFAPGETIHTEISCKYTVEEFQALAQQAGFTTDRVWTDERQMFSVHGLVAI